MKLKLPQGEQGEKRLKKKGFGANFTLLAAGQGMSLLGNSVLDLALSMYVLERTGSASVYGTLLAAAMLPGILLAPLGGVLADRADRRRLMVWLDLLNGGAVLLTLPFLQGASGVWAAGVLMVFLGILGAVETPVVQASLPQAVEAGALERANAAVLQISMLSAMVGPALGGILFNAFGAAPLLLLCGLCFWFTAMLERLIRLEPVEQVPVSGGLLRTVRQDLSESGRFLCREQPALAGLMGLTAAMALLCNGVAGVGAPFLIRTRLGLGADWYGAAGSALGVFGIAGSLAAGLLAGRMSGGRLARGLTAMGGCLLPAGAVFLLGAGVMACYGTLVAAFCGMQLCAVVFSVFARSMVQQRIPGRMMGKLMAFAAALEACGQPAGQLIYGFLFDTCSAGWVLLCTGVLMGMLGLAGRRTLSRLEPGGSVRP